MKTKFYTLLAIFVIGITSIETSAQWFNKYTDTRIADFQSVAAPARNKLFFGSGDTIQDQITDRDIDLLRSADGANSFFPVLNIEESSINIFDMQFLNSTTAYATSLTNSSIYKTTDGGDSWRVEGEAGPALSNFALYFTSTTTGIVVQTGLNEDGYLYRTTDGASFSNVDPEGEYVSLTDVYFPASQIGYSSGFEGKVYKTSNGGVSWMLINTPSTADLYGVYFKDVNTGFVVGENGTILKTTNGGASWRTIPSGTSNQLNAVYFFSPTRGFIAGNNGTILYTDDLGETWKPETVPVNEILRDISSPDSTVAYIVGNNSILKKLLPVVAPQSAVTFCEGSSVALRTIPASAWQWKKDGVNIPGATAQEYTATASGVYTVEVTDEFGDKGISQNQVTVTVHPLPAKPVITQNGNTLTSSVAAGYQWQLNGTNISGATMQNYTITQSGAYTVIITDINGCKNTSDTKNANFSGVGIGENERSGNVIYPNPANEVMHIENPVGIKMVRFYNVFGQLTNAVHINSGTTIIDTSVLSEGIYLLEIENNTGKEIQKVVIKR